MKESKLDGKQRAGCICIFIAASAFFAWILYDSFYALIAFLPFYIPFERAVGAVAQRKYTRQLTDGFIRALESVSTSLLAGVSPENAFISCGSEMEKLYGKDSPIEKEIAIINLRVAAGERLTDAINDLAKKAGIQEISDFAVVFCTAKENGSDLSDVISKCVSIMESNRRAENEAALMIRAKQYEQRVMFVIWPGILLYLRLSSGSFMEVLYHTPAGTAVMTGSLIVYVAAVVIAEKMGDIRV
ncbi:MAG: type II secretion system F family protein [Lachnospiraceae bacterium]|nr:type II secretion system F family protein [Lachnospiraceae bacterium]